MKLLFVTLFFVMLASASAQNPVPVTYQIRMFADGHERQACLFVTSRHWSLFQQNRQSSDGASPFSYLGVGPVFRGKNFKLNIWVGPQFTYRTGKLDRFLVYGGFGTKYPKFSFLTVNKLNFAIDGRGRFASRHIQNLRFSPLPPWLSLQGEELRSVKKGKYSWQEMEIGCFVNLGGMLESKSKLLKDFSIYPFRDTARGEWNVRLDFSHTF